MKKNNQHNAIGLRLKELRKERKLTQVEIANYLGVENPTISNYELGKSEPAASLLQRLADFYGVQVEWLITGRGQKYKWGEPPVVPQLEYRVIPVISNIPAGYPAKVNKEQVQWEAISDKPEFALIDDCIIFSGNSMAPTIQGGDRVYITHKVSIDDVPERSLVVARIDNHEAVIRRYYKSGKSIMLIPDNLNYLPLLSPPHEVAILGIVHSVTHLFLSAE